jgi:hypothetical protein
MGKATSRCREGGSSCILAVHEECRCPRGSARTTPPFKAVLSPYGSGCYLLLGVVVGDGVAAGCGAKLWWMSRTLSGLVFVSAIRTFQSSASRT